MTRKALGRVPLPRTKPGADFRLLLLFAALVGGLDCRPRSDSPPDQREALSSSEPSDTRSAAKDPRRSATPFADSVACRIDHGGMFLDLGTETSHAHRSFALGPFSNLASDTWSDQSYTRFLARDTHYDFWLRDGLDAFELRVRAKGGTANTLVARIDQFALGSEKVRVDTFETLTFSGPKLPLGSGRHQLDLRWVGRPPADGRPYGMAEWIHWAEPEQTSPQYRAPRQRSLRDDVVVGKEPRRALVLEAPASLGCSVEVLRDTKLVLGLGYRGEGALVTQIRARRDGAPPQVLAERRLLGDAATGWTDLELDLDKVGAHLVELELRALGGSAGSRLAVSEPRIVSTPKPLAAARAKLAVLIVASGLHRELLPPFGGTRQLRHLNQLAEASVRFTEYRVPTSVVGGVMASLISGLPPLSHGLETPKSRLSARVQTLADRLRETSGESALFTGVPQTRAAFGFERGWNQFEAFSPVSDIPASAPLERARGWLERAIQRDPDVPRLLVVHLRGGHPPWDLSREEVAELEPREYGGLLEARRGGIILAAIRSYSRLAQRRLSPSDWIRLRALQLASLQKQDAALGQLIELLERSNLWNDTLFAFTGDVASGDPPEAPFGAARPLSEERLLGPLWIKFPDGRFAGTNAPGLTTSIDVTATLAEALGVVLPDGLPGESLFRFAEGNGAPVGRSVVSTLGLEYSTRWGPWLLHGTSPKPPALCELAVDPACAHDVLGSTPIAAEALWRATFEAYRAPTHPDLGARAPEAAAIDKETAAALQVWGE